MGVRIPQISEIDVVAGSSAFGCVHDQPAPVGVTPTE